MLFKLFTQPGLLRTARLRVNDLWRWIRKISLSFAAWHKLGFYSLIQRTNLWEITNHLLDVNSVSRTYFWPRMTTQPRSSATSRVVWTGKKFRHLKSKFFWPEPFRKKFNVGRSDFRNIESNRKSFGKSFFYLDWPRISNKMFFFEDEALTTEACSAEWKDFKRSVKNYCWVLKSNY